MRIFHDMRLAAKVQLLRIFAAVIGLLFTISPLSAQIVNVEKSRLDFPEDKVLFGNIGANFTYHNRSVDLRTPIRVFSGGVTSDNGFATEDHLFMLMNNYQWLDINGAYIVNFGSTHIRAQLFHRNTISLETFSQYQYDKARGLDVRLLAGIGPRWRVVRTTVWNVALGTAAMYEAENWLTPNVTTDAPIYARYLKSSSYVGIGFEINPQVDLNAVTYYQVGYDRDYDAALHRVSGEMNLAVKLLGHLSFTMSLTAAWESRPIVPVVPFIFMVTNGIRYNF